MKAILVNKAGQKMWVKDPKKIKFWEKIAILSETHPQGFPVRVIKRVEDNEK